MGVLEEDGTGFTRVATATVLLRAKELAKSTDPKGGHRANLVDGEQGRKKEATGAGIHDPP